MENFRCLQLRYVLSKQLGTFHACANIFDYLQMLRGDFRTKNPVKTWEIYQLGGRGFRILPGFPSFEVGKWFL